LERKCLGILAFPLITLNGGTRSANVPLGNALEHFCGFNYQHHTLDKFLRELKYLGLAEDLLRDQVGFWQEHWRKLGESSELPFLCYYVDGAVVAKAGKTEQSDDAGAGHGLSGAGVRA